MIDLQDLKRMPLRLHYLILETISGMSGKQSDIAQLQRLAITFFCSRILRIVETDV